MKISKYIYAGMLLMGSMGLSGCQDDYDAPSLQDNKATWEANTTIAELKQLFAEEASIKIPNKTEAQGDQPAEPYIIKGRVISSDVTGNIFKALVIQDGTSAIQLSVNAGSLYTNYRVGQEVLVNATGLWGGLYHNLVCLGYGANEYGSLVTSRMASSIFYTHTMLNGLPVESTKFISYDDYFTNPDLIPQDQPYCIVIPDKSKLPAAGEDFINLQSQLVEIPNCYFTLGGEAPYAMKDENISRTLVDAYGNSYDVRNSGKSDFYNTILPEGKGTVRGILSYYNSNWQILIRDPKTDVIFDGKGTAEKPYTIEEVMAMDNNGRSGWVSGYIVGSVKAGVTTVSSDADVIFGANAELPTNVLIAADKNCTDITKCVAVNLPSGSVLRHMVNLVDNPEVLGEQLWVSGSFNSYLGMHGVTRSGGTMTDFYLGSVMGVKDNPYSIDAIIISEAEMNGVWVEGYVVGYVAGRDYQTTSVFNNNLPVADGYANNNIILSSHKGTQLTQEGLPVRISSSADRKVLGIGNNPGIFGKKVKMKVTTGNYTAVNYFGILSIDEYEIED